MEKDYTAEQGLQWTEEKEKKKKKEKKKRQEKQITRASLGKSAYYYLFIDLLSALFETSYFRND